LDPLAEMLLNTTTAPPVANPARLKAEAHLGLIDEVLEERKFKSHATTRRFRDSGPYGSGGKKTGEPFTTKRNDLHSAGVVGLLRACEKLPDASGPRFNEYASECIRNEIGRALKVASRDGWKNRPQDEDGEYIKLERQEWIVDSRGNKTLAIHSEEDARIAEANRQRFEDDVVNLLDRFGSSLGDFERRALRLRFWKRYTYAAIGKDLGVSESTAQRHYRSGLVRLHDLAGRPAPQFDGAS
jgi:RNA polymerase sigma factor (sigma-70 family)